MTTAQQTPSSQAWDEARLAQSIAELNELHLKLRRLRTLIRRVVEPLAIQQPSAQAMISSFSASMTTTREEMAVFRRLWTAESTREVLDHALQSRRENPMGIRPWRSTFDPGDDGTAAEGRK
jgi:hypothetical protein